MSQAESGPGKLHQHEARSIAHPKELIALGIREYRETYFKPYRIIYRTIGKQVFIYLIADGRRAMQSLLSRRMLSM